MGSPIPNPISSLPLPFVPKFGRPSFGAKSPWFFTKGGEVDVDKHTRFVLTRVSTLAAIINWGRWKPPWFAGDPPPLADAATALARVESSVCCPNRSSDRRLHRDLEHPLNLNHRWKGRLKHLHLQFHLYWYNILPHFTQLLEGDWYLFYLNTFPYQTFSYSTIYVCFVRLILWVNLDDHEKYKYGILLIWYHFTFILKVHLIPVCRVTYVVGMMNFQM